MGKVFPKDVKQKRKSRNTKNKYLRPGSLSQLRNSKASTSKQCTDIGKKRVAVLHTKQVGEGCSEIQQIKNIEKTCTLLSPVRYQPAIVIGTADMFCQNYLQNTPKTPRVDGGESESRLESLPNDLLVKILCHLHHDQLRAVFHVSQKIRKAVIIARQFYFNYTTPDRSRQEMLNMATPLPTDHWPFMRRRSGKGIWLASPHAPKAPKHGPRLPSRLKFTEMRQIAAVLFPESSFSSKCLVPSVLQKPGCKSAASNRVLFYEDDLCQAVAQNKLL